jgi:uncharacterized protein YndB with AHSA1/START domain
MTYTVDVNATSAAPAEAIFYHLARADTWAAWAPIPKPVRAVRARAGEDADPDGVGAVRRIGPIREEVVAYDPPRLYAYTMLAGFPIKDYRADVTFDEPGDGGTAIRWRGRFEPKIPGTGALTRSFLTVLLGRLARDVARHCERCGPGCPAYRPA